MLEKPIIAVEQPGCETLRVPVLKVFDGDGFLTRIRNSRGGLQLEATVRFGFIDAPEMEQPGGIEAQQFLSSLIAEKWLDLVVLKKMDTGKSFDRHGRLVCIPYLLDDQPNEPRETGSSIGTMIRSFLAPNIVSRNIELEMVLNGWAWVLDRYGPDESYSEALEDARRNKRGIWSRDDNVHPWEFKKAKYREKRRKFGGAFQASLPLQSPDEGRCPNPACDGRLIKRSGKFGPFLGCSNFPICRHTSTAKFT